MNEETKQKLLNAGFIPDNYNRMAIENVNFSISVKPSISKKNGFYVAVINKRLEKESHVTHSVDFEFHVQELNKACYPFNGCKDLNFEGKKYSWEECFKEWGYYVEQNSDIIPVTGMEARNRNKNIFKTESAAISGGLAHAQLTHIVAAINADFEHSINGHYFFPIIENGIIKEGWASNNRKLNPFKMNSKEACAKLIETNSDLLYQYFETEKP